MLEDTVLGVEQFSSADLACDYDPISVRFMQLWPLCNNSGGENSSQTCIP